ncbi:MULTISPECIES: fumarylacetoacetate hydrolase family protein [Streptomyces violaceusniger group]|uniref:fumarylacetoacetate hydrolase family protein n=1 Tax=Streptomyces violaceusniger group TaxID=2839105 RepID=UPI001FCA0A06|nr:MULTISPECIES: fumarylacetoacetate hydrolase family protein [Streptomyces violaceusniger group]
MRSGTRRVREAHGRDVPSRVAPGHGRHTRGPRGSVRTDWEVELAVVIGTRARYLPSPPGALSHIAGSAGVALGLPDRPYLRPGDQVELSIDGLGEQRQVFAAA